MKTLIFFLGLMASGAFYASGQPLVYEYDASGNRVKRKVEAIGQSAQAQAKATSAQPAAEIALDTDTATVKAAATSAPVVEAFRVTIYPNPTEGFIEIDLPDLKEGEKGRIRIYSLLGASMYDTRKLQSNQSLEISHFTPGIYALYVTVNDKTVMRTIIKL